MGIKTELLKALCQRLGKRYIGFRGNPKAPIWVVGEAPGADEDQAGVPFVGYSGRELDKMLKEAGFDLQEIAFINPYTVRPPGNDIEKIEETGISKQTYLDSFFELLFEFRPKFLCPVGATPCEILCPRTIDHKDGYTKIGKWRGSILQSERLQWPHYIIPNLHPAYILREWSDRDTAVFVFRKLREEFEFFQKSGNYNPLPNRSLITNASFGETKEFLLEALNHDGPIAEDFELLARCVPYTLAFAISPTNALSMELFGFSPKDSAVLWKLIDCIHRTKTLVGQNWSTFDANWATALGLFHGITRLHDTLVEHHVLHPELSHKLDFLGMQYTREPYWKDEGKTWRTKGSGLTGLKHYNCLDAACDLEIHFAMQQELQERHLMPQYKYEMALARRFYFIDQRGLFVDESKRQAIRSKVIKELEEKCLEMSQELGGRPVVFSEEMGKALAKQLGLSQDMILNVSSDTQLKKVLVDELKIPLKKDRRTGRVTTSEDALNEAFAKTQSKILKHILRTRELNKLKTTYIDTRLCRNVFYSSYTVTGTNTGRRASRKNVFGFGGNGQNLPKHGDLAEEFRGVFVSRPDKIFLSCDQVQAEDWVVQAIIAGVSGHLGGINELRAGVDRHQRLASQIFALPLDKCGKGTMERYLGKKTRHAGNYGMRENKMSAEMAKEGFSIPPSMCKHFLNSLHYHEPDIQGVFQKWVEEELKAYRLLRTPLDREREFHGLRPGSDNGEVFREAYAYIPQSTVGDNTGRAILIVEEESPGFVLADGHDAILGECLDSFDEVWFHVQLLRKAYDRDLIFMNGFTINIPIEFELGYNLKEMKKCPLDVDQTSLRTIYNTLQPLPKVLSDTMNGVQLQPLAQPSSDMSGLIV